MSSIPVGLIYTSNGDRSFIDWAVHLNVTIYRAAPYFNNSEYVTYTESTATSLMKSETETLDDDSMIIFFIIVIPFVIWILVLMGLKVSSNCNTKRGHATHYFGFLSGQPFTFYKSSDDTMMTPKQIRRQASAYTSWENKIIIMRFHFIFACVALPIISFFLIIRGYHQLEVSKNAFIQSNENIHGLTIKGNRIIDLLNDAVDTFGNGNTTTYSTSYELLEPFTSGESSTSGNICPSHYQQQQNETSNANEIASLYNMDSTITRAEAMTEEIKEALGKQIEHDIDEYFAVLEEEAQPRDDQPSIYDLKDPKGVQRATQVTDNIISIMEVLSDYVLWNAQDTANMIHESIRMATTHSDYMNGIINEIDNSKWVFFLFPIPFVIIPLIMFISTIAAHAFFMHSNTIRAKLLSYCFLPLLIIWILLAIVFSSIVLQSSTSIANYCSAIGGLQDGTTDFDPSILFSSSWMSSMNISNSSTTTMINNENSLFFDYDVAKYYMYQCSERAEVDPFLSLRQADILLDTSKDIVHKIDALASDINLNEFGSVCGTNLAVPLYGHIDKLKEILKRSKKASQITLDTLDCEKIVPVYTNVMYDGVCANYISGLTWTFLCLLTMAIMGMILLTLRSSYQNSILVEEEENTEDYHDKSSDLECGINNNDSKKGNKNKKSTYRSDDYDDEEKGQDKKGTKEKESRTHQSNPVKDTSNKEKAKKSPKTTSADDNSSDELTVDSGKEEKKKRKKNTIVEDEGNNHREKSKNHHDDKKMKRYDYDSTSSGISESEERISKPKKKTGKKNSDRY